MKENKQRKKVQNFVRLSRKTVRYKLSYVIHFTRKLIDKTTINYITNFSRLYRFS